MSGKNLRVLIVIALGAVAFGASYGLSLWLGASPTPATADTDVVHPFPDDKEPPATAGPAEEPPRLEEKHLMALIRELRAKRRERDEREQKLREEEHRLQIVHQDLQKEAQQLETLRGQAAAELAKVKEAKAKLQQGRITIRTDEEANLKKLGAMFDTMDAAEAAKTFEQMCKNNQEPDAVKILHHMTERTTAKVLAAMSDKAAVAGLCEQMKRLHKEG